MIGRFLEWIVCSFLARRFPARFRLIPRMQDGAPLLRQFKVFSFGKEAPKGTPPWWHCSCYLQSFASPESSETFHVHRWRRMISFVLSGMFVEERLDGFIRHSAPGAYTMGDTVIHRLAVVVPRTWTLFFMFGRARHELEGGWGYFDREVVRHLHYPLYWAQHAAVGSGYRAWDKAITTDRRVKSL